MKPDPASDRPTNSELHQAARNLLLDCAGLHAGDSILIVHENPRLGWWSNDIVETVCQQARTLGLSVELLETGAPTNRRDGKIEQAMRRHGCSVFFARVGDQDRFAESSPDRKIVMCYARDNRMLASAFGRVSFKAMRRLKLALDRVIAEAQRIDISCPDGSDLSAVLTPSNRADNGDVSILRFPMGIVSPVPAGDFSGQAAITGYLTPTGSAVYEPACLKIDTATMARIDHGVITGFEGETRQVRAIEDHYHRVADQFDLDPFIIHSWHAGIHPGLQARTNEDENPDRWGNTVFNHPGFLHFHSCGAQPPGEISWMLRRHRVKIDGVELWDNGSLLPHNFTPSNQCLQDDPELDALYADASS